MLTILIENLILVTLVRNNFKKNSFIADVFMVQNPRLHRCQSKKMYLNNIVDVFLFQFSFIFLKLETFKQTEAGKSPSTEFLSSCSIFCNFFMCFSEVNFDLS